MTIVLDSELAQRLEEYAKETDRTISSAIRVAIRSMLDDIDSRRKS